MPKPKPKKAEPEKKAETKKPSQVLTERPVVYPEVTCNLYIAGQDPPALTPEMAMVFLGWKEVAKGVPFDFQDLNGNYIVCENNQWNRPLDLERTKSYAQDMLNQNWADSRNDPNLKSMGGHSLPIAIDDTGKTYTLTETYNGEDIVIGRTGKVLSAQKRLVGLVFAEQMRQKNPARWKARWGDGPVNIEIGVKLGISESDRCVRTIDNVSPRTDVDVILTSSEFKDGDFKTLTANERAKIGAVAAHCLRELWKRTRAYEGDVAHEHRTHSEFMDFFQRHHEHVLKSVSHISSENTEGGLKRFLSPGYASALLYLMGSSASDLDKYRLADYRAEDLMDWSRWEDACEFWVLLNSRSPLLKEVTLAQYPQEGHKKGDGGYIFAEGEHSGSKAEKMAVLCKAWNLYANRPPKLVSGSEKEEDWFKANITKEALALHYEYELNDDKTIAAYWLREACNVGGIDQGDPAFDKDNDENGNPDPADVEEEKAKVDADRRKKAEAVADKLKAMRGKKEEAANTGASGSAKEPPKPKDSKPPAPKLLKTPLNKRSSPVPKSEPAASDNGDLSRNEEQLKYLEKARKADEELAKESAKN